MRNGLRTNNVNIFNCDTCINPFSRLRVLLPSPLITWVVDAVTLIKVQLTLDFLWKVLTEAKFFITIIKSSIITPYLDEKVNWPNFRTRSFTIAESSRWQEVHTMFGSVTLK